MAADPNLIHVDPKIMRGKPVVRGTRLTVEFILDLMAGGWTEEEIFESYPSLNRNALLACLAYARDTVERAHPAQSAA
jgi:uncharacterized protein (DUF433 family)